jgi:hypothetical protein
MAATTANAVKALIEAGGLGLTAYRDEAPDVALPYCVIFEAISVVPEPAFSQYDDPDGHVTEQVQVSMFQQRRHPTTNAVTETYTLPDALCALLGGGRLTVLPNYGGHVQLVARSRTLEDERTVAHDALTIEVRRTLARRP